MSFDPPPPELLRRLEASGAIAVVTLDNARDAVPLAHALIAGGIDSIELTLRTPAAWDAIARVVEEVPEMLLGAGTVLDLQQVERLARLKAAFALAPGTNPRVIAAARESGLPFFPGVATPSDIEAAGEQGCRILKFFPAEGMGGLAYLRQMAAPYEHLGLRFIPLGGVRDRHLEAYGRERAVLAVGGSWIATRAMIAAHRWELITENALIAHEAMAASRQAPAAP
jgi:2-dehydro-3-deoxyphosphogluconate aldolase/(4S)-4-hydroxy-2-oxoglutarate aldolase